MKNNLVLKINAICTSLFLACSVTKRKSFRRSSLSKSKVNFIFDIKICFITHTQFLQEVVENVLLYKCI